MRARHMLYGYIRPLSTPSTSALSRYMLFIFPSWPPRRVFLFFFFPSFLPLFERSTPRDLPEDRGSLRLFSPFRFVSSIVCHVQKVSTVFVLLWLLRRYITRATVNWKLSCTLFYIYLYILILHIFCT